MNERIRLIAELADKAIRETDLREVNGGIHITPAFEKFAELIVRECITICQHNADDDDDQFDLGRVHQAKEITHLIKKHFVVEP